MMMVDPPKKTIAIFFLLLICSTLILMSSYYNEYSSADIDPPRPRPRRGHQLIKMEPDLDPDPNPDPKPSPSPSQNPCPRDVLKFGICASMVTIPMSRIVIGMPPDMKCCSMVEGLIDMEAAICLCTALKANIMGVVVNLPISLSMIVNNCGKNVPPGYQCP
ncbi:hypothetical protein Dimus_034910 [Dionaea muscipula]